MQSYFHSSKLIPLWLCAQTFMYHTYPSCTLIGGEPSTNVWDCQQLPSWPHMVRWRLGGSRHLLEQHWVPCMALQWEVRVYYACCMHAWMWWWMHKVYSESQAWILWYCLHFCTLYTVQWRILWWWMTAGGQAAHVITVVTTPAKTDITPVSWSCMACISWFESTHSINLRGLILLSQFDLSSQLIT